MYNLCCCACLHKILFDFKHTYNGIYVLFHDSPMDNSLCRSSEKTLDEVEYKVFKHRSHMTIVVFLCIFLILYYIPSQYVYYSNVIAVSIYAVTLFTIIGKIQLSRLQNDTTSHWQDGLFYECMVVFLKLQFIMNKICANIAVWWQKLHNLLSKLE